MSDRHRGISFSIKASGLPTKILRPTTTACLSAESDMPVKADHPGGVQLRNPGSPGQVALLTVQSVSIFI